jgi:hypothetical protein
MYKKLLLVPYKLRNTVITFKGWLNIRNLTLVDFCDFFKIFPKKKKRSIWAFVTSALRKALATTLRTREN